MLNPVHLPARSTAQSPDAQVSFGQRLFAMMQARHMLPGQLSVAMLREALQLAQWEAQALYAHLTQSRKSSAFPKADMIGPSALRGETPMHFGVSQHRLLALLDVIDDHKEARTALHTQLCQMRHTLKDMQRACRATPAGAAPAAPPQAIRDKQAELIAQSRRVYAYPFPGEMWPEQDLRHGAGVHAGRAPPAAEMQAALTPNNATPHR